MHVYVVYGQHLILNTKPVALKTPKIRNEFGWNILGGFGRL